MRVLLLSAAVLFTGVAQAQTAGVPGRREKPGFSVSDVIATATGVLRAEGKILGMGPGYRAWFDKDGVTFGAPGAQPLLRWKLESVGRREQGEHVASVSVDVVEPETDGDNAVIYSRGTVTERYEVRENGVEQSFVFDELPEGDGDLVVRLRLETDLTASADGRAVESLLFTDPTEGGVSIATVTGIDANGARAPGVMRLEEGWLELILPSSFAETAAMPLVLDPLIGTPFSVGPLYQNAQLVDSAYDATNDRFLVAWNEAFHSYPGGIGPYYRKTTTGQLVSSTGALVGPLMCLDPEQAT